MNKFPTQSASSHIVCIATSWYPHSGNPYYCVFVQDFAKRLLHHGITVFVVTTSFGERDEEFSVVEGVPVFRLKLHKRSFFKCLTTVLKLFNNAKAIHIHAVDSVAAMFVILGKFLRKSVILTVHRADVLPTTNKIYYLIRFLALRLANLVTPVSLSTRRLAIEAGAHPKKTIVVYNTVNESVFKPKSKEHETKKLHLDLDAKIILFVGNLIPRKSLKYLIKAMQLVVKRIPNSILLIVGDGPERRYLESLVSRLGLNNSVRFLGRVPTSLLALYYNTSNIFVLPSLHEGHAVVLLEAMASGLPVIATNVGGNAETIIDGVNGYLVNPTDVDALANRITQILDHNTLAKHFGNASVRIYQEKFSETAQMRVIKSIYKRLNCGQYYHLK